MELNISILVAGILRGSKKVTTPCMIGRSKEASLTVTHPSMSRKHCELYEESGKLFLRDNSSLNGTIYKGDYVESPVQLQFGDSFSVGELTFKISSPSMPLTEEQKEIVNRPTAAFTMNEDSVDNQEGMVTVLQPPSTDETEPPNVIPDPATDAPATGLGTSKKESGPVSPKDVRIVT